MEGGRQGSPATPEPSKTLAMKKAALTSLSVLACVAAALSGQQAAPSRSFDEELSVEVINVEVHVTDRKGRPVMGLAREDFRLLEDGDPVEITYFSEVGADSPSPPPDAPAASAGPAAEVAAAREPRNLVIYLDDANLSPAGRRRVLADLRQALAAGGIGADRWMLVVRDGGLQIVQPLTEDREEVLAAVAALPDRATGGMWLTAERLGALRDIKEIYLKYEGPFCVSPCDCGWQEMEARARQYGEALAAQMAGAADALSQLASALSGVDGRKIVLYAADGLEQRPGLDLFQYVAELCPLYERELAGNYLANDQASLLNRLTAHANANGVTFHTLEGSGLQTEADISEMSMKFAVSSLVRQVATANRQSPLFALAADTGGRAALNTNSFDAAIQAIGADFETYYSLGFTSRHRGDGRLHRIEVEVPGRRGLQVRHRSYYRDKELETRLAERVWSALLLGTGANAFGAELEIGEPRLHGNGCCTVPVGIRLPLDRVGLGKGAGGRFYVVLTGRTATGKTLPIKGREVVVEGRTGEEAPASRTLVVEVDLAPGRYEIAAGLLDYQGGGEAYLRTHIEVEPPRESAPASR